MTNKALVFIVYEERPPILQHLNQSLKDLGKIIHFPASQAIDKNNAILIANWKHIEQEELLSYQIPTIALIDCDDSSQVEQALKAGCIDFCWCTDFALETIGLQVEKNLSTLKIAKEKTRYHKFLQNSSDFVLEVDLEGKILYTNKLVTGMTMDEALSATLFDYTPPDHHFQIAEALHHVKSHQQPFDYEIYGIGETDGRDWYWTSMTPMFTNTQLTSILINTRVITQKKLAEQTLQALEVHHRQILESSLDYIMEIDLEGRYLYLNRVVDGMTPADFIGQPMLDFVPPEERYKGEEAIQFVKTHLKATHYEIKALGGARGEVDYYSVRLSPIMKDGQLERIAVYSLNITELKEVENEIRRKEEYFRQILNASIDYILEIDFQGHILYINRMVEGLSAKDVMGVSIFEFTPPNQHHIVEEAIGYVQQHKRSVQYEIHSLGDNDTLAWYLVRFYPVIIKDEFQSIALSAVNISDLKETQERLTQKEKKLIEAQKELQALNNRLIKVQEEERKFLSREVHDVLGQSLSSLRMVFDSIKMYLNNQNSELNEKIILMDQLITETIYNIRKIARSLRPRILDDLSLVEALEWQVNEYRKHSQLTISFGTNLSEKQSQLNPNISSALLRVLQEAFTNIIRHSEATKVDIKLTQTNWRLTLFIKDNGIGYNETITHQNSLGIRGMRERITALKGQFSIQGQANQETIITVQIPLSQQKDHSIC